MKRTLALMALVTTLTAGSAFALPYNDRPGDVVPGASSAGGELSLQQILNAKVKGPNNTENFYNAVTSQSTAALWKSVDANSSTFLVSLYTAHSNGKLGIYSQNGQEHFLIDRSQASPGTAATFSIVNGDLCDTDDNVLVPNFGNVFGFFWLDTVEQFKSYTEDDKNTTPALSSVRALTYQLLDGSSVTRMTKSGTTTEPMDGGDDWIIAFEDHPYGDYDYNDTVFLMKDISAVPEPGTMMLLGAGFLGLAIYGKRRKNA
ncbi:PEP-CTERM sorting domain-containing protein [Geomonas sp. RF6]|uniref:PEP-CTERM sorting domain-containing protein n=1 Tax=Geomonas sp. RF6 TaxID=2897342 RepID=UPI001E3FC7E6|nr:PEP-CTERM sorting domain-containing protein [Geomonas sp. RF6]UFS69099.1 PEP-CTERM sorting domain-containing protein [Geomonas sp. RF6]